MRYLVIANLTAMGFLFAGCGGADPDRARPEKIEPYAEDVTVEEIREKAAEAVAAAAEFADQTREQFVNTLEVEIKNMGQRMDALRAKGEELGEEARRKLEERMEQLEETRQSLRERLADVADSAEGAWRELAEGLTQAREQLAESLRKAEEEVKE